VGTALGDGKLMWKATRSNGAGIGLAFLIWAVSLGLLVAVIYLRRHK